LKAKEITFKVKIGFDQIPSPIWMLGPLRIKRKKIHPSFRIGIIENVNFKMRFEVIDD
jgi:hypothetical protein